jgi:hypothetical protein
MQIFPPFLKRVEELRVLVTPYGARVAWHRPSLDKEDLAGACTT